MTRKTFYNTHPLTCSVLFCITLSLLIAPLAVSQSPVVNIPDATLLAKIKKTLDIPAGTAVTQADMLRLTNLGLGESNVSDLTGLEYATNLKDLYAWDTQVSDISALSTLTNLEDLSLIGTQVSDISALSTLTKLERLHLNDTQVSDISALSTLTNLRVVGFGTVVNIPDETLLAKIKEELNISAGTAVTSADMLGLTSLDLSGSDVSDLTGLEHATNLEELDLGGTQVSDVLPLANLINLRVLDISDTQVSDISPLSD